MDAIQLVIAMYSSGALRWNIEVRDAMSWVQDKNTARTVFAEPFFGFRTYFVDTVFTADMCRRFEIEYSVQYINVQKASVCFGYVPSQKRLAQWHSVNNYGLGWRHEYDDSETDSNGLLVDTQRGAIDYPIFPDSSCRMNDMSHKEALSNVRSGDSFRVVFDFDADSLELFHCKTCLGKISLNGDQMIITGVSMQGVHMKYVSVVGCFVFVG